jgi:hypothetical protein
MAGYGDLDRFAEQCRLLLWRRQLAPLSPWRDQHLTTFRSAPSFRSPCPPAQLSFSSSLPLHLTLRVPQANRAAACLPVHHRAAGPRALQQGPVRDMQKEDRKKGKGRKERKDTRQDMTRKAEMGGMIASASSFISPSLFHAPQNTGKFCSRKATCSPCSPP